MPAGCLGEGMLRKHPPQACSHPSTRGVYLPCARRLRPRRVVGDRTGPCAAIPAAFSSPLTVGSAPSLKIKRQIVHFSCNYQLKRPSGEKKGGGVEGRAEKEKEKGREEGRNTSLNRLYPSPMLLPPRGPSLVPGRDNGILHYFEIHRNARSMRNSVWAYFATLPTPYVSNLPVSPFLWSL